MLGCAVGIMLSNFTFSGHGVVTICVNSSWDRFVFSFTVSRPRVFVTYCDDTMPHVYRVLGLERHLLKNGFPAIIDLKQRNFHNQHEAYTYLRDMYHRVMFGYFIVLHDYMTILFTSASSLLVSETCSQAAGTKIHDEPISWPGAWHDQGLNL